MKGDLKVGDRVTYANPQDEVIILAPYWVSYPEMVRMVYGVPVIVKPEDGGFYPRMEDVLKAVSQYTKAIIVNSPNNPSGVMYPEEFIDRVIARKRVWAPWYTLHKIMAGLLDMYTYCGNKQALDILERMAAWAKLKTDKLNDEAMQQMLQTEFGGLPEPAHSLPAAWLIHHVVVALHLHPAQPIGQGLQSLREVAEPVGFLHGVAQDLGWDTNADRL
jgi:hypothetical protein